MTAKTAPIAQTWIEAQTNKSLVELDREFWTALHSRLNELLDEAEQAHQAFVNNRAEYVRAADRRNYTYAHQCSTWAREARQREIALLDTYNRVAREARTENGLLDLMRQFVEWQYGLQAEIQ